MYQAIITKSKKLDADVAIIVTLINDCLDFHALPKAGGLFDQDSLFMSLYHHVQEARAVRAELDSQKKSS